MSRQNVELFERAVEAWNRGDLEAFDVGPHVVASCSQGVPDAEAPAPRCRDVAGVITRLRIYPRRVDALEALGLSQ